MAVVEVAIVRNKFHILVAWPLMNLKVGKLVNRAMHVHIRSTVIVLRHKYIFKCGFKN